ncbi:tetratricopeptide repeat protein [Marinifilum sp. D737]|uniref:tetratricopeptide repeat protein n=1 Tax=Marinifilum sp. D737 TaxID=2969628 RepID=UPI00227242A0|nr:hypothetical protein [Marinifilum sp. D737]MCY1633926.1 hypothetical protein [Marinifilum sp. D737]
MKEQSAQILWALLLILLCGNPTLTQASSDQTYLLDSLTFELEASNSNLQKINILMKLSEHYKSYDLKKGLEVLNSAYQLAENTENKMAQSAVLLARGDCYIQEGHFSDALNDYLASSELAKRTQIDSLTFQNQHRIGFLYFKIGEYQLALDCLKKSMVQIRKNQQQNKNSLIEIAQMHNISMGACYTELNSPMTAIDYLNRAREPKENSLCPTAQTQVIRLLARAYLKLDSTDTALHHYQASLKRSLKRGESYEQAANYHELGKLYFDQNQEGIAKQYCYTSIEACSKASALALQKKNYMLLYQIFDGEHQLDSMLWALNSYHRIKKNLDISAMHLAIMKSKLGNDLERAKAGLQRKSIWLTFTSTLGGICLLVLGILLWYWKRTHKDMKDQFEEKKKDLTTNSLHLVNKNKLIEFTILRLLKLKNGMPADHKNALQKIIFDLQESHEDKFLKDFELRFAQVHDDFFERLQKVAPELSPSELRLCAYLRLNLNTKEISKLLLINSKSIEVKRSHIRRKLNINNTDTNLNAYLNTI